MRLWTLKSQQVFDHIIKEGEYICDDAKSTMLQEFRARRAYDWLVQEMKERIGMPPEGVTYPVWAYLKKPDLSKEFNTEAPRNMVCIELEIDEKDVLITNHCGWSVCCLNSSPYITGETDEEFDKNYDAFEALPCKEQEKVKFESWKKLILPIDYSGPIFTQATFWKFEVSQIVSYEKYVEKGEWIF